jgi:hypothetical protein
MSKVYNEPYSESTIVSLNTTPKVDYVSIKSVEIKLDEIELRIEEINRKLEDIINALKENK